MEVVRRTLSPELLNRIDDTVIFNRLQRHHMDDICAIGLKEISDRLENGQNMTLDVSADALSSLTQEGYDVRYGARPLKRVLASRILNPLSKLVLDGGVQDGDVVKVRTIQEAEAWKIDQTNTHGWVNSNVHGDENKNDVVILRNHP